MGRLQVEHAANPLDRRHFLPAAGREAPSCDRRLLQAVRLLSGEPPPPPAPLLGGPSPMDATTASDALPDIVTNTDAFSDLRHWLAAPQAHWLQSLGLRPGEWEKRIDDLEALSLGERERSALLRGRLQRSDGHPGGGGPGTAQDWLDWHRGEGVLPPRAAADLEASLLQRRWSSLAAALERLGPSRQITHQWGPWQAPIPWRGETVVLVHTAQARVSHRLGLWLQLLLAAAAAGDTSAAGSPARGVLIARDGDVFGPALELRAPAPQAARAELERLAGLQRDWRRRGWPVPPETGWSYAVGERKRPGQGRLKAASTWEGSGFHSGERERAEMEACFGARLPADALLTPEVLELADALFSPLLAAETEP
jgi:exodeoxyribonuclease V gamma subunit